MKHGVTKKMVWRGFIVAPCAMPLAPCILEEFKLLLAGFFVLFLFSLRGVIFFKTGFDVGHKRGRGSGQKFSVNAAFFRPGQV